MKKLNIFVTIILIFSFFICVGVRIGYLYFIKGNYYRAELKNKTEIYLEGK